ncbi:MAG: fibronectin type III domain-containing protein [Treponema sp.]|nr:fibronectin type III domain-containing protein [Treponema sp.]
MKNTFKIFGFAVLAAIIGFSMISCDLFDDWLDGLESTPNTPTNVRTYRISPTSVYITWNSVSDATSYKIQYSSNNSLWYDGGTTSGTNYTDIGWPSSSNTGYLRVAAVNSSGTSSYSSGVYFPTFASTNIPYSSSYTGFTLSGSVDTIRVHSVSLPVGLTYIDWVDSDNATTSLSSYTDIEVGLVRGSTGLFVRDIIDLTSPTNRISYTVPSGQGGTYYVIVRKRARPDATEYDLRVW